MFIPLAPEEFYSFSKVVSSVLYKLRHELGRTDLDGSNANVFERVRLTIIGESSVEESVGGDIPRDVSLGNGRIREEVAGHVEVLRPLAPLNHQRLSENRK